MIHELSVLSAMHNVSATPSVQMSMTARFRSAVMYRWLSRTNCRDRRCRASIVSPTSLAGMLNCSATRCASPASKKMRVGGRKYMPSSPNGVIGGGGGAGLADAAKKSLSQYSVYAAHPAPKKVEQGWLNVVSASKPDTPASDSAKASHVGAQIGREYRKGLGGGAGGCGGLGGGKGGAGGELGTAGGEPGGGGDDGGGGGGEGGGGGGSGEGGGGGGGGGGKRGGGGGPQGGAARSAESSAAVAVGADRLAGRTAARTVVVAKAAEAVAVHREDEMAAVTQLVVILADLREKAEADLATGATAPAASLARGDRWGSAAA
jgi:hypothetical protein